jgi:hypothetical protein
LCDVATPAEQCPAGTDLSGVWFNNVTDTAAVCDIADGGNPATNLQAQCIKCADLAATAQGALQQTSEALIGTNTTNVFTVCNVTDNEDPRPAFADLVEDIPPGQFGPVNASFDECLDNAGINPGNGTSTIVTPIQTQSTMLQEKSFTTNVKPESGISTFSPPSIPSVQSQGTGDLTAMEKITKLKQQWLDNLS